jgi:hypothetical protein
VGGLDQWAFASSISERLAEEGYIKITCRQQIYLGRAGITAGAAPRASPASREANITFSRALLYEIFSRCVEWIRESRTDVRFTIIDKLGSR